MIAGGQTIVIAAGGTGGHLFPAQSLTEELVRRGRNVILVTDERGRTYSDRFPNVEMRLISAATFAHRGPIGGLYAATKIFSGTFDVWAWFGGLDPAVVVGFGGYPSLPTMTAAILRGRKTIIHESNALLGRVNRGLARHVTYVASAFPDLARLSPRLKAKLRVTGNPVRDEVKALARAPYTAPTPGGPLNLLVFGGSQGAKIFGEVVPPALIRLPDAVKMRLDVVQQARDEDLHEVRGAYRSAGIKAEIKPFFNDMAQRLSWAHLVIARAGAGTVSELAVIGRPSILVPLPGAMDDHQTYNAKGLVAVGGAWLLPQKDMTVESLRSLIAERFADSVGLARAAQAAQSLGHADAQVVLADLVESLCVKSSG